MDLPEISDWTFSPTGASVGVIIFSFPSWTELETSFIRLRRSSFAELATLSMTGSPPSLPGQNNEH